MIYQHINFALYITWSSNFQWFAAHPCASYHNWTISMSYRGPLLSTAGTWQGLGTEQQVAHINEEKLLIFASIYMPPMRSLKNYKQ